MSDFLDKHTHEQALKLKLKSRDDYRCLLF